MCGFLVNIANNRLSKKNIYKINDSLFYRGPDQKGYFNYKTFSGNNLDMLHTRLEILGLGDSGSQPMQNEKFCLVFNGEIYNHNHLTKYLGSDYKNEGDTKVLLDLCMKLGIKHTISLLKGIFSKLANRS